MREAGKGRMFAVGYDEEKTAHELVAPDGGKIEIRDDVWERLRSPDMLFKDFKLLVQKWSIHTEKAPLLKRECPTDSEYRQLRSLVRMYKGK